MSSTLLKILQSEWISILYQSMHEHAHMLTNTQFISLLTCINLLGMKYLIMMLTFTFLIKSKVYHHLICLSTNQFLLQISPCFYLVLCLFLIISQQLTYIASFLSPSETFFTVFGLLKFKVLIQSIFLLCCLLIISILRNSSEVIYILSRCRLIVMTSETHCQMTQPKIFLIFKTKIKNTCI